AAATGRWVLADDSGLEVMALGGAPGIFSARYAGEEASDAQNLAKLLQEMSGVDDRRARFVCVMAFANPAGDVLGTVRGTVSGRLLPSGRGSSGFGYDPAFVPDRHEITFAEMDSSLKNSISHRSCALQAVLDSGLLKQISDCPGTGVPVSRE
ncbi:MAG: non-canonical purine NTP pyrophosphatase, partial [Lentisphaerae bacterium]|nr:non-canonical purine NTP pyrophosphatase [Lentisphaerota bacterium]